MCGTRARIVRAAELSKKTAGASERVRGDLSDVVGQMRDLEGVSRSNISHLEEISGHAKTLHEVAVRSRSVLGEFRT